MRPYTSRGLRHSRAVGGVASLAITRIPRRSFMAPVLTGYDRWSDMPPHDRHSPWPNQRESDFIIKDFRFGSGETLPELRQHYHHARDAAARRAGRDRQCRPADPQHHRHGEDLAGADARRRAVRPRASRSTPRSISSSSRTCIGFGRSSKPSDGLRANFPHYRCTTWSWRSIGCVTEALGIPHLKLVMGTLARRHADLDVRRDVSGLHGRAGADREPARRRSAAATGSSAASTSRRSATIPNGRTATTRSSRPARSASRRSPR